MTGTTPVEQPSKPTPEPLTHDWVAAATIDIDDRTAKHADLRLSFRAAGGQRIDVLDVYCRGCRRTYEDVADTECEAKIDNSHLIGGDKRVRARRKKTVIPANAERIPGQKINRVGVEALVLGP